MAEHKFYSPFKIGLLIVIFAYFMFTLHAVLTLQWVGEWERLQNTRAFVIFVEDISATIGMIFRLIGSVIAFGAVIFYFIKKEFSKYKIRKILQTIIILEAIYWLGLLPSGILPLILLRSGISSPLSLVILIVSSDIPALIESIVLPAALIVLALKLNQNKPPKDAIKWALIAGTIYILVFWLVNTGIWILTILAKGIEYITTYPENLQSFVVTGIGLLVLTIYSAYFTKKSKGTENLTDLKLKTVGTIITLAGLFFLWSYLTWIFFGRDQIWSLWYAWLLGHNLDLWMLALPLVGLPLLFEEKNLASTSQSTQLKP